MVFRLVVSSFNSLLIGKMPPKSDSNESEEEICEGKYFGFLYVVTADMEYASNVLRLEHFNSVDFCWLCDAQQAEGDLNFRNLASDAPWRSTLVDPQHAFIEDGHFFWTAAGIGRYTYVGDWLHTVHLGIMCHLLASVMDCIADTYAGNKEVRSQHLWNDLVKCHKEMGTLTADRNRFPSFPFIKLPSPCHARYTVALHNLTPNMYMSTAEKYAELKHVRASEVSRLLSCSSSSPQQET